MSHVLGIGGVFIRSQNQAALVAWYEKHFGLKADPASNTFNLSWADGAAALPKGLSVLAPFAQDTDYFRKRDAQFMLNLAVTDLEGLLVKLRADGVEVEEKVEKYDFGTFAWVKDPDGRTIELWEPR